MLALCFVFLFVCFEGIWINRLAKMYFALWNYWKFSSLIYSTLLPSDEMLQIHLLLFLLPATFSPTCILLICPLNRPISSFHSSKFHLIIFNHRYGSRSKTEPNSGKLQENSALKIAKKGLPIAPNRHEKYKVTHKFLL